MANGALIIVQAMLLAHVVAFAVTASVAWDRLTMPLAALVCVIVLRGMSQYARQSIATRTAGALQQQLRARLQRRLHAAGPAAISGWHHAELAQRLTQGVDAIAPYVAHYLPQRNVAIAVPALIVTVAMLHDWLAGLLLLFSAPLIPLFMALVGWGAQRLSERFEHQRSHAAASFADHINGLRTLRLFQAEAGAVARVGALAHDLQRDSMRVLRVAFLSSAVLEFFAAVAVAAVAIYVGFGLLGYIRIGPADTLTLYSGLCVLLLAPEFFAPMRQLAAHYHDRAAALGAAAQLLPIDRLPAMVTPSTASGARRTMARLDGIRLRRDFGVVLNDFHLHVESGELVVLRGASGCGKTSVLHVLAGHLAPERGRVTVMGQPAGTEGQIGWVGQQPFLLPGSIATNIRLGPTATKDEAELQRAAALCGVMDFARWLPEGLETVIGEHGIGLSGGQARRVALARVWLSAAPLLLIDEPTAGLDADSARPVLLALRALCGAERGVLVASHDPLVAAIADRCIDLDKPGR